VWALKIEELMGLTNRRINGPIPGPENKGLIFPQIKDKNWKNDLALLVGVFKRLNS
jgi:hypothetical protein